MKKLLILITAIPLLLCLLLPQNASAKTIRSWQELLKEVDTIKIYLAPFKNSTGDNKIKIKELSNDIENALKSRISKDFVLVNEEKEAMVVLKSDIVEYYWTLEDPIDQIHSSGAIAMDMIKKEHYVRMTIDFSLFYVPTNRTIWEKPIKATITDKDMTRQQSYSMINERMVKVFIRNLFKKKRNRLRVHSL